ncbi:putative cyclin-dependent serine/threonine-protein kinase DDB_G0272797/DDB_G0274007 isoform X2 [Drosophila ficusphila]|uniref:putative cyclin-dependent serine/threonine-protein kinase DDB_G0272797/DDB_G0274007 isoform X2 n=1 Tax=Drosophila ficusphila TaxID=30025 RepID=UPI0007E75901|nr:putative cyclin-dependent serine/threonine-protein kinase DDB_G0272797/DDB_G0274007 isoform X2 [Drosophila ficusphila]
MSESEIQIVSDELDANETAAATQVNVSSHLAKKIWAVTPNDVSMGLVKAPEPSDPHFGTFFGLVSGIGCENKETATNDNAFTYVSEVERALYGDPTGYPENGSHNYFKAAENYSLFGENFLDFSKDTASCLTGLEPMFYKQMHYQQQPQPQLNPSHNQNHIHLPQKPQHGAPPPQQQQHQQHQQQQQQHRLGATPSVGDLVGLGGQFNPKDLALSQLCQQFMACNLRPNQQHHQQHPQQQHPQQKLYPQQQQAYQQQHQTPTSAAAAAAMLYKNLDLQQQVQLIQLQQLHQQQQQQQQQSRFPRPIFGRNFGQPTPPTGNESAGTHK